MCLLGPTQQIESKKRLEDQIDVVVRFKVSTEPIISRFLTWDSGNALPCSQGCQIGRGGKSVPIWQPWSRSGGGVS